jgi:multiple sugar transport system substrate-binding protein
MEDKKLLQGQDEGLSRRDFIKTGLAGAAAVGLAGMPLDALAQTAKAAAPATLEFKPEKGAVLRVLRWEVFVQGDKDLWNKNTKKWEEQTGCKVMTEYIGWEDVRPKAAMAASVGAGHDMVLGWHDDPHLYPDKLIDVTDLATYLGQKYGGWEPVCLKYGINPKTGRWIAIPMGGPVNCINYRESWVKEAGYEKPPSDIQNFIKMCKKLKANGHPPGFALGHAVGDGNNWTHQWLWTFGGKSVDKGGSVVINSPETRNALEAVKELYETLIPGTASWLDPHNNKAFLAGEISVTTNGISIYAAAKDKWPEIAKDMNHVNMPIGPVGRPTELHLFNQAFIFKFTRFPNACKHYLMFMLEEPQAAPWINAMIGYVGPSLKAYKKLPVWTSDPKVTPFRECIANMLWNGYEGPEGPASAAAMAEYIVVDLMGDVCVGGKTPKEAALIAEQRLARCYKKAAPPKKAAPKDKKA